VTSGSPLFLSTGNDLLTAIGIIMLVIYGLKWATHSASRHHPEFDFPGVIHFFALFLIAEAMLRYYDAPLPWTSSSFHQILPDTARQLAGTIDLTSMDALLGRINSIVTTTERPGITDPLMFVVYIGLLIDMIMIEGILFAVTILGFIAVGIGSVLGPIFIPWLIVPRLSWLFWNWIQFMLQYSFYRVVASALTFVWTTVIVKFLDNAVQGDYSLAHFLLMLVPLGMLNIGMIFSVFRVTSFVSDLFKGTAAAGGGLAGSVAGAIRGAFA
jgi:type IV secretory pathway VirB6-like protein